MPNKTYGLYPKAVEDIENIYVYSVKEFGYDRADDYIHKLEQCFKHLSSEPGIARKCDYIRQNLRAYNIGSHIIFFKETGSMIVIIRILHKSMDHERHL